MQVCKHCGWQINSEPVGNMVAWVDEMTGGDVCGWGGGNEPHEPMHPLETELCSNCDVQIPSDTGSFFDTVTQPKVAHLRRCDPPFFTTVFLCVDCEEELI